MFKHVNPIIAVENYRFRWTKQTQKLGRTVGHLYLGFILIMTTFIIMNIISYDNDNMSHQCLLCANGLRPNLFIWAIIILSVTHLIFF